MVRISSVVLAQSILLVALSSTIAKADAAAPDFNAHVDMDSDGDGVSDYDDYCPHSPKGAKVWTKEAVDLKHGQANWVGCAGGADTAQPDYTPVKRPAEPTIYEKVAGLYAGGSIPTGDNLTGVSIGRCFNPSNPTVPSNKAVYLQGAVILSPDGPITGNVPAFSLYFLPKPYGALDGIDSIAQLETVIGEGLDANSALNPAHLEDKALVASFRASNGSGTNSARINGEYLVLKHTEGANPAPYYCYFFHKIMNP